MNILNRDQVFSKLEALNPKRHYGAMFSTIYGGYVTDPALMLVPLDDHLVHRGDGVFEAARLTTKGYYLLKPHLDRLARSADIIGLKLPLTLPEIATVCENLRQITKLESGGLRLFVSRGPGDFSPSPYSTIGSQLYAVLMGFDPMPKEKFENGVSAMFSGIPVKPGVFAQVKSCNYLPNVMTKKESLDRGFDFAVNITPDGFVAEGPTENILVLTKTGDLVAPRFDYSLRGTTLVRVMELAQDLVKRGQIHSVEQGDLRIDDLKHAREIMMVGTTLEVLPVVKLEDQKIADGRPGAIAKWLRSALLQDM
jgi:4-amino-4-deoxychorismate lyase